MKAHLRLVRTKQRRRCPRIGGSTLFVMGATLASTLLGFFREVINARSFGTQWEMDTFLAAAVIPTILFGVFNGALLSALVPIFVEYVSHERDDDAWILCSTVINGLVIVLTLGAVAGYFLAPWYVPVIAHGFPAPQMSVAVHMTRMLIPSILAVSLSGVFSAILNAYQRFRSAALVGVALNVVTIGIVVIFSKNCGIYALVFGTVVGFFAQFFVQLPAFLSVARYKWVLDFRHPGFAKMMSLLGPIVVGSAAGQLALFFDRFFASTLTPGYIAGMNYATKLVGFPQQIFAAAIATVIFPLLAKQFAVQNRSAVARSIETGLRLVNFITMPAVTALIVLAHPIVQTLFERGSFGPQATELTASLLPFSACGLLAISANVVLTRCCFACRETAWPVAISVITVLLNILLSIVWLPTLGARGLLLANSVSQIVQATLLLALLRSLLPGIAWKRLGRSCLKSLACSLTMFAALHWIEQLGVHPEVALASRVWYLLGQIFIGTAVFFASAKFLNAEEIDLAWRSILAKFTSNVIAPAENCNAPIA